MIDLRNACRVVFENTGMGNMHAFSAIIQTLSKSQNERTKYKEKKENGKQAVGI